METYGNGHAAGFLSVPCDISSGDDSCSGDFGSNVRKKIQNGQLQNVKINTTYIYNGFYIFSHFYALSRYNRDLIYRKENIGHILYLLSFTGIFIYLQQTLLGIMNGLGKQGILLRNSIVGYVIRILFVIYFVPSYGIADILRYGGKFHMRLHTGYFNGNQDNRNGA